MILFYLRLFIQCYHYMFEYIIQRVRPVCPSVGLIFAWLWFKANVFVHLCIHGHVCCLLGVVEMFNLQWNVISATSVVSMTWLIVLWGPRVWLAISKPQQANTLWHVIFTASWHAACPSNYLLCLILVHIIWPPVENLNYFSPFLKLNRLM